MPNREALRRIASSDVRANLADLLRDVGDHGERILIERRGKSSVALVSVDDLLRYQLLEEMVGRTAARSGSLAKRRPAAARGAR